MTCTNKKYIFLLTTTLTISGTEQYLMTCTNKKYIFLLTTTLTISENEV